LGTGKAGSGCWIRLKNPYHRFLAGIILRQLGLPANALSGDLESLYIAKLLSFIRSAPLEAAVILAMDSVYDENGKPHDERGSFFVPNRYVLELSRNHPEFLPGVSIHPARPDALPELERCLEGGAVLMKCLPIYHNIDCNNPRYTKFWERMAEAKLPLLAHTGGELSVPVFDKRLADPRTMTRPLEIGVTVIMAHSGTASLPFEQDYTEHFGKLLERFPNLYGDNSALNTPFRSRHLSRLLREPYSSRMVHGSDLPIPISATWAFLRGLISWEEMKECRHEQNPLTRDILLKKALGFGPESFTRLRTLLRQAPAPQHSNER
jgi:predicted TIM-barrel fold metal-dependent hydrolase